MLFYHVKTGNTEVKKYLEEAIQIITTDGLNTHRLKNPVLVQLDRARLDYAQRVEGIIKDAFKVSLSMPNRSVT